MLTSDAPPIGIAGHASHRDQKVSDGGRREYTHTWVRWVALIGVWLANCGTSVSAQELLWSKLPEDGSWVRFRGTWKDVQERPESNEGPLELSWLSELTIKSVGREDVQINGASVPCRWIEFKSVIGYQSADGIQPGPYGSRIYKVLIPEAKVTGDLDDETKIAITFLPIVRGYRKIGEKGATPIKEKVLVSYPMLALLPHYKQLVPEGDPSEDLDLQQLGTVAAKHFKGTQTVETETTRSVNEADLWLSPDMPFGLAKYRVKLVREEKEDTEAREEFKKAAEIDVEMVAIEKGANASSEIADTDAPAQGAEKAFKKAPLKDPAAAPAPSEPAEIKDETTDEDKDDSKEMEAEGEEEEKEMKADGEEAADESAEMPAEEGADEKMTDEEKEGAEEPEEEESAAPTKSE